MTKLRYPPKTDTLFKLFFTKNIELLRSFLAAAPAACSALNNSMKNSRDFTLFEAALGVCKVENCAKAQFSLSNSAKRYKLLGLARGSIGEITVINPEILPDFASGKTCRVDLRLTVDGQVVDVEIQVENEHNFRERSLFYWAKLLSETLQSGGNYKTIPKVILISLVDFDLFDCEDYHSEFRVQEKTRHEELTDKFAMHFYELPKVPALLDGEGGIVPWLTLFRAETEEDLARLEKTGGKEMVQAVQELRHLAGTPEFLHLETLRELARLDEGQKLSNAEERGIAIGERRGERRGEKRGRTEGRTEIINLLRQGVSAADILAKYGQ